MTTPSEADDPLADLTVDEDRGESPFGWSEELPNDTPEEPQP